MEQEQEPSSPEVVVDIPFVVDMLVAHTLVEDAYTLLDCIPVEDTAEGDTAVVHPGSIVEVVLVDLVADREEEDNLVAVVD